MAGWTTLFRGEARALLTSLNRSLAIIEFDSWGGILAANANFCAAVGYERSEIVGRHHSIFVEPGYARSDEYRGFWAQLGRGQFDAGEYKRLGKGGREVWIQASYNPVPGRGGSVRRVVKVATDITREKMRNAEYEGKVAAISRVQAVIEFTTGGEIIDANDGFLQAVGYILDEIRGRHHRMFVDPDYARSAEYTEFWARLNRGEYMAGEFRRIGKDGREIHIQASYNPILDADGRILKVVKFATDATGRIHAVKALGTGLAELAAGHLAHGMGEALDPAYEKLRTDYNAAAGRLRDLLGGIAANAMATRSGTDEIAGAADDLARRTTQAAASLQETAAALEQITVTGARTAEGARLAHEAVSRTRADADVSGKVVRQAVDAMAEIERSSGKIGQIMGVIDEIAFQTNLLALNAGVEAARAGDAGRGFAVVATEVRALAGRSAEAAREINTLISLSTGHVSSGVALVGQVGEALSRIVGQVAEMSAAVADIATSAREQATGLAEVNKALNEMEEVTQQNAAMVEEATAATHGIARATAELAHHLEWFDLGGPADGSARPTNDASPERPARARPAAARQAGTRTGSAPRVIGRDRNDRSVRAG